MNIFHNSFSDVHHFQIVIPIPVLVDVSPFRSSTSAPVSVALKVPGKPICGLSTLSGWDSTSLSFFSTTTKEGQEHIFCCSRPNSLLSSPQPLPRLLLLLLLLLPLPFCFNSVNLELLLPSTTVDLISSPPVPIGSPRGQSCTLSLEDVVVCTEPARQFGQIRGDSCGHDL